MAKEVIRLSNSVMLHAVLLFLIKKYICIKINRVSTLL